MDFRLTDPQKVKEAARDFVRTGKISSAVGFPVFELSVGPVQAIKYFGPDQLRQRIVPAVCRGEMVVND